MDARFAEFSQNPGASDESIRSVEQVLGKLLPRDYRMFLARSNGGEGFIGEHYLILWKIEELPQFNRDYQVEEYAPGLLVFASNGGGEAFAFDTKTTPYRIVQVPFIGMSLKDSVVVAENFEDLLERMVHHDGSLL